MTNAFAEFLSQWSGVLFTAVGVVVAGHVCYTVLWKEFRPRDRTGWGFLGLFFAAPFAVGVPLSLVGASEQTVIVSVPFSMAVVIGLNLWVRRYERSNVEHELQ